MHRRMWCVVVSLLLSGILVGPAGVAQVADVSRVRAVATETPTARLLPAPPVEFPEHTDSNSPAVWALDEGVRRLFVFVSSAHPLRLEGPTARRLGDATPVELPTPIPGGVWMEALLPDEDALYGYYHQEADV